MYRRSQYSCALLTHPPPNNECSSEVPKHEKYLFRLDKQMACWKKQNQKRKKELRTTYGYVKLFEIFFFWLVVPSGAQWRRVSLDQSGREVQQH